jgi:hypothetical protein
MQSSELRWSRFHPLFKYPGEMGLIAKLKRV